MIIIMCNAYKHCGVVLFRYASASSLNDYVNDTYFIISIINSTKIFIF